MASYLIAVDFSHPNQRIMEEVGLRRIQTANFLSALFGPDIAAVFGVVNLTCGAIRSTVTSIDPNRCGGNRQWNTHRICDLSVKFLIDWLDIYPADYREIGESVTQLLSALRNQSLGSVALSCILLFL